MCHGETPMNQSAKSLSLWPRNGMFGVLLSRFERMDAIVLIFAILVSISVVTLVERAGGPALSFTGYIPNISFYLIAVLLYVCGGVACLLVRYRR